MSSHHRLNASTQPEAVLLNAAAPGGGAATARAGSGADDRSEIYVARPILGHEEQVAICEVLDDGWVTMGSRVRDFELAFAERHRTDDAVAVSSCTAALHLILHALGIGPGDEVLVPSLTFVATANSVLYTGASPVFVDIGSLTMPLMSLEDAAQKCSPRTKAVIVVHYAGCVAQRSAWRDFASRRGLFLIGDAAHAVGLEDAATFGDAAAFSFYGNKNMTTAEGGMVVSTQSDLLERVRQMRGHGMTSGRNGGAPVFTGPTAPPPPRAPPRYDVTMLGYNYRMDELRAAMGLVQLGHLTAWNERRRVLTARYAEGLAADCPTILVPSLQGCDSAHHIMPVVLPAEADRDRIIASMRSDGIQTSIHYPPVHDFSFYRSRLPDLRLPKTEEFSRRELTLPLHPGMADGHVERVVAALAAAAQA